MKKSTKILLGIATIWPILWIPIFILAMFSTIFFSGPGAPPDADVFPTVFLVVFPLHMLTVFGSLALSVFYIVNIFRNKRVEKDKQVLWVVLLLLAGMIAEPIYWYLFIWRDEPAGAQSAPKPLNQAEETNWTSYASSTRREHEYRPPQPPPTHGWRD